MLEFFREKFTGWVALAILGAIGLSFVFVGLNYNFTGQSFAAKVDGETIGVNRFENAYREQLQNNPQLASLPAELRAQFRRNVLERLVQEQVIDNYLDKAGIRVSDEQLMTMIQQFPDFQVDGRFDMDTYVGVLQGAGISPAEFEAGQRANLRRTQLQRAIRGTSVVAPSAYRRFLNLAFEERVVQTAILSDEAVADEINVTDDMISAYYDDNPLSYRVPESADVEYVEIRRDEVAAAVEVSEQDLRDYYEFNKDRYLQDERRQARHILILFGEDEDAAEASANAILARINAGEPFEDLAREASKDGGTAPQGGDLGALTETQLPDALGDAIFSMTEGELRGPVKGDFGFHIVRLDEILVSGPMPFDQVRASLLTEMQEDEADNLYRDVRRDVANAQFDAETIGALAEATGLELKSAAGVTRSGGGTFNDRQPALDTIFDPAVLSGSQMSELVELDSNSSAVFFVTRHTEASREPLDAVRDRIVAAITLSKTEELLAQRARAMQNALESGDAFADAAAAVGAEVQPPVSLRREQSEADQFLTAAVFAAAKPPEDTPSVGNTRNGTGGYTVYSIQAVIEGRPEAIPLEQRDAGKLQIVDTYGIGDFVAFVQSLRGNADVVINEDMLAAQDLLQ